MMLLEVEELRSGYGPAEILHGVSLQVGAREIVAIIGPNGCGKSTLLKTVMGYVPWAKGSVRLEGDEICGKNTGEVVRQGGGFVPQLANVFGDMSVRENLEMGGFTLTRREVAARMTELLDLFPVLRQRLRQKAGTMSGGERQLVALASALMASPRLLLLDEPSAGLSPSATAEMFEIVRMLPEKLGTTILLVEQDVYGALDIAARGYVLAMGSNEFSGTSEEILTNERIGVAYLGAEVSDAGESA